MASYFSLSDAYSDSKDNKRIRREFHAQTLDAYDERTVRCAEYITETGQTVRAAAIRFGLSKSTVHKDMTTRLAEIDGLLFEKVRTVLDRNKAERHMRGGLAHQAQIRRDEGKPATGETGVQISKNKPTQSKVFMNKRKSFQKLRFLA